MTIYQIDQEQAFNFILIQLRSGDSAASYGYDVYLPSVINAYINDQKLNPEPFNTNNNHNLQIKLSPNFLSAAWELCRRGILRPGVKNFDSQATSHGSAGYGYSITPFGVVWIKEATNDNYVPTEPERFGEMLKPMHGNFGSSFALRAQEAVRCYGAHAFFACCAMCGAAAESILLSAAVKKSNDEEKTLKTYRASNGRSRIENELVGKKNGYIQKIFFGHMDLLKYWRDASSHGHSDSISDNEAFTSLATLLRMAHFVDENWDDLTSQ